MTKNLEVHINIRNNNVLQLKVHDVFSNICYQVSKADSLAAEPPNGFFEYRQSGHWPKYMYS